MLCMHLVALALAVTTLTVSSCGGTSKTASTASKAASVATTATVTRPTTTTVVTLAKGKPLTHTEWIAKGDTICTRANAKTSALTATSVADFARIFPQVALYNRTEAAELSKLVPPRSFTQDWTQFITELRAHAQYVTEVAQYVQEKNENAAGQPFRLSNVALTQLVAIAKRDGFKRCSMSR